MSFRNRVEPESEQEDGVVDFTNQRYDNTTRISNGFNIEQLTEGIIFNPEELDPANNDQEVRYYSATDQNDLANLLEGRGLLEDEEDLNKAGDFDEMKKVMVDITPTSDGGVLKRTARGGVQSLPAVPKRAVVTIHYSLYLEGQDEPFDSSLLRGKAEKHKIGTGELLVGLEMGILTMRKGEKAQMIIDYPYALGECGCPPRIPEKAQIFATVELIDYKEETEAEFILSIDGEERKKNFSFSELEKIAQLENSNGNQFHQEKEYAMAFRCYERGRRLMEEIHLANEEEEARCNKLLTKLLQNAALCANKLYWPRKACIACKEALRIKESAKAFYAFGVAKRQLGDYQAAKDLLLKAQRKEPQSVSISNELRFLEDDLLQERRREEAMCKNMFKNVKKTTTTKEPKVNSAVVNIYLKELKEFRDDPTHDVFTLADPALIVKDLKEIRQAAATLGLSVEEKAKVVEIRKS